MSQTVMHYPDISWLLRGVAMVPVPGQNRFRLWTFVQPLYVPADRLMFRYGRLLSRVSDRDLTSWPGIVNRELGLEIVASVRSQGLPVLGTVRGPAEFLEMLLSHQDELVQPENLEAAVYSAVLVSDVSAIRLLSQQIRELRVDAGAQTLVRRVRRILAAYERSESAAVGMLSEWRDATVQSLRLAEWE